ncbi:HEPN domain-containing protein, partial [[Flexibacter] sp. ATCC 35208]|uniref:HEPN domain-containing protein n=1 Tax=[Flexibacter] sp. ATCC 35208 TaxID=1936242 RepID=UPI0009D0A5E9
IFKHVLKITLSSEEFEKLSDFSELISGLEKVFKRLHPEVGINVLWNDIARKFAIIGYEAINEVENLLRRLITSFMLINVGYDWHKFHIPKSVEERDAQLKQNYSDYLHQTYFSDLKTILFEGQREPYFRDIGDVQLLVQKAIADKKESIPIRDLKGIIATSLWEKYFAKDSTYKKQDLESDLEKLNLLRNEIAHNRHINRETLGKIESISKKIIKTLKLEFEDLPNKQLTIQEQKFQIERETSRIKHITNNLRYFEKILIDYYSAVYQVSEIRMLDSGKDHGFDFLIKFEDFIVAVILKQTNVNGLRYLGRNYIDGTYIKLENTFSILGVTHLDIFVFLTDYSIEHEPFIMSEIKELRDNIDKMMHLIVGFIDDLGRFKVLKLGS